MRYRWGAKVWEKVVIGNSNNASRILFILIFLYKKNTLTCFKKISLSVFRCFN